MPRTGLTVVQSAPSTQAPPTAPNAQADERRAAEVAEHSPVGMCTLDRRLECTWANERFDDLAAVAVGRSIGRRIDSLLPDLDRLSLRELRRIAVGTSEGWHFTVIAPGARPPGGGQRRRPEIWRVHAHPVPSAHGIAVGLAAVDVSDDPALAVRPRSGRRSQF